MKDFSFTIPQDVIFGSGSFGRLPELLAKANCKHVFLVSDPGLKKVGLVDQAVKIISDAGFQYTEFLDLQPNPTVHNVKECTKNFKASGAETIIALGGGGPMDVAKAAGLLNGTDWGGIDPGGAAERGQTAAILVRFWGK